MLPLPLLNIGAKLGLGKATTGIIIYGILAAGVSFATWKVFSWREASLQVPILQEQLKSQQKSLEDSKKIGDALEVKLAALRKRNSAINESLRNEVSQDAVYTSCILPAGGVRVYNSAVKGLSAF